MAARKLAAEIDKTLKKIAEGVQEFESIYEKLQNASTPSQSAKYESELKTSIKRLQRSRDQVKTWLQTDSIKDKSALMENRRLIETQMEKFKASEKELKTKAFSKEGLANAKLDPAEKAKLEMAQWLSSQVDELGRQVETSEAELEQLTGGAKKKKAGAANERAAEIEHLNDRRKWHSSRLEILLRMLENGTLETERVVDIKEDISYFVESNADEEFEEDDGIYDEFHLDEEEEAFGLKDTDDVISHDDVSLPDETTPPPVAPAAAKIAMTAKESPVKARRESEDVAKAADEKQRKPSIASVSNGARKASGAEISSPTVAKDAKAVPTANFSQAKAPPTGPSAPASSSNAVPLASPAKASAPSQLPPIRYAAAAAAAVSPSNPTASPISTTQPAAHAGRQASEGAAGPSPPLPAPPGMDLGSTNGHVQSPAYSHAQSQSLQSSNSVASTPALDNASVQQQSVAGELGGQPISPSSAQTGAAPPGLKPNGTVAGAEREGESAAGTKDGSASHEQSFSPAQLAASSAAAGLVQAAGGGAGTSAQQAAAQRQQGTDARLPSSLADLVSSFESAKQNSMRRDPEQGHKALESSLMNVPDPQDSDKPRYYVAQNPYPTPQWYPQTPASLFDNPSIYTKFDEDTLFYIFYYSHRDYHRYLAARELKRQSWRFSIRYGTWFRRHSEPIAINEEYEEGSYVYFDFESSWCQRRKNHFRFEYKYLESELV